MHSSAFPLFLLLVFQGVAGVRYSLPFFSLNAHSLALALAFTATLLNPLHPGGTLALMDVLPGMGGNARIRIQDRQV